MRIQSITAGDEGLGASGGNDKFQRVLGNYISPREILKQLKEQPQLYYKYQQLSPGLRHKFLEFCAGTSGLSVCYDPVFKFVFHPENHPERLSRFLSCIIGQKVKVKRVLANEGNRITADSSLVIMDIVVELEDGTIGNVEIQKIPYLFPGQRAACYSSDLVLRQYVRLKGKTEKRSVYKDLKPVYTIVIFEVSGENFHEFSDHYIHRGKVQFDTGLNLELLQNYIYVPLDVFREIHHNQSIKSETEAWLSFLAYDDPEHIWELQEQYPYFRELYQDLVDFRKDVGEVLNMFSDALAILDKNTVEYMIELQEEELKKKNAIIRDQKEMIGKRNKIIDEKDRLIGKKDQLIIEKNRAISQLQDQHQQTQQTFLLSVKKMIKILQDLGLTKEDVEARLGEIYALSQEESKKYVGQYWDLS